MRFGLLCSPSSTGSAVGRTARAGQGLLDWLELSVEAERPGFHSSFLVEHRALELLTVDPGEYRIHRLALSPERDPMPVEHGPWSTSPPSSCRSAWTGRRPEPGDGASCRAALAC